MARSLPSGNPGRDGQPFLISVPQKGPQDRLLSGPLPLSPGVSAGVPEMLRVRPDWAAMVTCKSSSARFIRLLTRILVLAMGCKGFWTTEFTSWKNFSLKEREGQRQIGWWPPSSFRRWPREQRVGRTGLLRRGSDPRTPSPSPPTRKGQRWANRLPITTLQR